MGACLSLSVAACSSVPRDANVVVIDDAVAFQLLSPASFGEHVILTQLVNIRYVQQDQPQEQELLFYSELSPDAVNIAVLLPDGTRLFSVLYDGSALQSDVIPQLLGGLDPWYLLADMQIALWPLKELRAGLARNNVCFASGACELTESADQRARTLRAQDGVVIDIRYEGVPHYSSTTHYQHLGRHYQLTIATLDLQVVAAGAAKEGR